MNSETPDIDSIHENLCNDIIKAARDADMYKEMRPFRATWINKPWFDKASREKRRALIHLLKATRIVGYCSEKLNEYLVTKKKYKLTR